MSAVHTGPALIAVADLIDKSHFWVPAYQRGYRWGRSEVDALLDDLYDYLVQLPEHDYCLQPVVVKPHTVPDVVPAEDPSALPLRPALPPGTQYYELIDGQQRLTTLYLLDRYFATLDSTASPFSLSYQTRPGSAKFLAGVTTNNGSIDDTNIDYWHISTACQAIRDWFEDKKKFPDAGFRKAAINDCWRPGLKQCIKLIWFEAGPSDDAIDLFTRLNAGRIALSNAELVKALLLADHGDSDADARVTRANQWDEIEHSLQDSPFWHFLTQEQPGAYATRIDLLLRLEAKQQATAANPYAVFVWFQQELDRIRTATAASDYAAAQKSLWDRVWARYTQLREWFADRRFYHRIGWLVASGEKIDALMKRCEIHKDNTKQAFLKFLDTELTRVLAVPESMLVNLRYDNSDPKQGKAACTRALLLFNVLTLDNAKHGEPRYPFDSHHQEKGWSLEHIHAQSTEGLTKEKEWRAWLDSSSTVLKSLPSGLGDSEKKKAEKLQKAILQALASNEVTKPIFDGLEAQISKLLNRLNDGASAKDLHTLANLALLSGDINTALSNASFSAKRLRLLNFDREGRFIPPCTRNVFVKYYTDSAEQQLHFWSKQDREAYLARLEETLSPYHSAKG